jgi:hypothetical protein
VLRKAHARVCQLSRLATKAVTWHDCRLYLRGTAAAVQHAGVADLVTCHHGQRAVFAFASLAGWDLNAVARTDHIMMKAELHTVVVLGFSDCVAKAQHMCIQASDRCALH